MLYVQALSRNEIHLMEPALLRIAERYRIYDIYSMLVPYITFPASVFPIQ